MLPFPLGDPLLRTRLGNFPQIFGSMHSKKKLLHSITVLILFSMGQPPKITRVEPKPSIKLCESCIHLIQRLAGYQRDPVC